MKVKFIQKASVKETHIAHIEDGWAVSVCKISKESLEWGERMRSYGKRIELGFVVEKFTTSNSNNSFSTKKELMEHLEDWNPQEDDFIKINKVIEFVCAEPDNEFTKIEERRYRDSALMV